MSSVADVVDANPWKVKGTYQFYSGHDWTAWTNYAYYEAFINEVGWAYYCNPYVSHSC